MSAAPLTAALFDLDGTLIDSEPRSQELWRRLLQAHHAPASDTRLAAFAGRRSNDVLAELVAGLPGTSADSLRAQLTDLAGSPDLPAVALMPGARAYLRQAHRHGLRLALVTSATAGYAEAHLVDHGVRELFDTLITAEDITQGKPSPEGFLLACERLGCDPARAVVFEDSAAGLQAARAAGVSRVITIGSRTPPGATEHAPDFTAAPRVWPH